MTIDLKPWNCREIKNTEINETKKILLTFPVMWHTYLMKESQKGFSELFLSPNQMKDYGTKPEVCLNEEECNDHLYVCREIGWPHTIMDLLHVLIQTLINITYRGIQLLSTSTYLSLAKVCRLYYIGRYSKFFLTLSLLPHQLSCRSPQNSPKIDNFPGRDSKSWSM